MSRQDFRFPSAASLCALVTPMRSDGTICIGTLRRLIERHCEAGSAGLVLAGTTGEGNNLSDGERQQLIAESVATADRRLAIIAGTGCPGPARSIELSRQAADLGVDAVMLAVPAYSLPPQEGLYRHFMTIADALDLPIMLYNVPHRTVCDLKPETTARLAEHPNILAIKDSLGQERFVALTELLKSRIEQGFRLYSGSDNLLLECLSAGAHGIVSVTANLAAAQMAEICRLHSAGQSAKAAALHEEMLPLHEALFRESNPIAVKWAMQQIGLLEDAPGIRLPLVSAGDATQRELLPLLAGLKECGWRA